MKRTLILLIALLTAAGAFGANHQKTYLMTDSIWQQANRLCIMQGVLGPVPVSPTTGEDILRALRRVDQQKLNARDKACYDGILKELDAIQDKGQYKDEEYAFLLSGSAALEGYAYNHAKSTYLDEFFIPYRDRPSIAAVQTEFTVRDSLYLVFQYDLRDNYEGFVEENGQLLKYNWGKFYAISNASYILSPRFDGDGWDYIGRDGNDAHNMFNHTPLKAGASIGNENYNFFIGRNRQAFGNGQTGNFIIGDNFTYQEFMKAEASTDFLTYELSLTHFDNTQQNEDGSNGVFSLNGYHQNRTIQRFDLNFNDRLRFAMNIGGIFNTDSPLDWRLVMPMGFVHNWVNNKEDVEISENDEGNNIMGFELEYVLKPGLFLSSQVVIDQFQLAVEKDSSVPNAVGGLVNMTQYSSLEKGILETQIEGFYMSPFLYLNTKYRDGKQDYGYDFIVGYGYDGTEEVNYTGHPFGPGTMGLNFRETFFSDKGFTLSGNVLYKAHGNKGIHTKAWEEQNQESQTWAGKSIGCAASAMLPTGTLEHTLRLDVTASYPVTEHLTGTVKAASISQWNYHNESGDFKQSIQTALGLKWTF